MPKKKWSWLQKDTLLTQVKSRRKPAYLDFVSIEDSEEIKKFYSLKNMASILGSTSFKNSIQEKFSRLVNRQEIPESKVLALESEKVITCVCEHFRISSEQLLTSKRGTENLPRDIAIYLVRWFCCKTLPSVGREFGITNYSTVSSVIQRVKIRSESDKYLLKEIEILKKKITKGQKRT